MLKKKHFTILTKHSLRMKRSRDKIKKNNIVIVNAICLMLINDGI